MNYEIYTKKIAEIKVPHSIYDLFVYEDSFDFTNTNIHYGMYELSRLKEEMENLDYDLSEEDRQFIYDVYELCENLFKFEDVDNVVFQDEDF